VLRALGSLLLAFGLGLLGLAAVLWWDGSHWGRMAAYLATVLGLFPLSWGVLLRWHRRAWSGFAAAALALVAGLMAVPGIIGRLDPASLLVAAVSVVTVVLGLLLGNHRLRKSDEPV
jgi:hypothetical protein